MRGARSYSPADEVMARLILEALLRHEREQAETHGPAGDADAGDTNFHAPRHAERPGSSHRVELDHGDRRCCVPSNSPFARGWRSFGQRHPVLTATLLSSCWSVGTLACGASALTAYVSGNEPLARDLGIATGMLGAMSVAAFLWCLPRRPRQPLAGEP